MAAEPRTTPADARAWLLFTGRGARHDRKGVTRRFAQNSVDGCADAAQILAAEYEPFEALRRWIQRYLELIMTKRELAAALHSGEPGYESLPRYFEERLTPALQGLLEAAGSDIRADISAVELLRAEALLCPPAASGDSVQARRMVALLVNGLRVPGSVGWSS
jgi:hypothetical protein